MNFNSIKVRLKHPVSQARRLRAAFQFHKGTIKTLAPSQKNLFNQHFNSIKVRLKLSNFLESEELKRFQFHKGTIKTHIETDGKRTVAYISIP